MAFDGHKQTSSQSNQRFGTGTACTKSASQVTFSYDLLNSVTLFFGFDLSFQNELVEEKLAIESMYWKEELARISATIRPIAKPKRWSERLVCTVERDVMIGCFLVRRMIELKKVTSHIAVLQLPVFSVPSVASINLMSRFSIEKNYNWGAETTSTKPALYVCNQCIHAYISFVERGPDRNWSDLLVVSDYDRSDLIWRIPFTTLITLFEAVASDWPTSLQFDWDEKKNDFLMSTD